MDENEKDIQKRVAEAMLQRPISIYIGGRSYNIARPSFGTLVLVSEMIARLPHFSIGESANLAGQVISEAKEAREIPMICAALILGARNANKRVIPFIGPTRMQRLAKRLSVGAKTKELREAMEKILLTLDLGDFFALTTFLNGVNLTKPTKVETEATAPGR